MDIQQYYSRPPSDPYGSPRGGGRTHRGTDFSHSTQAGTVPVPALLSGVVVEVLAPASWHGFGHQVKIASGGETLSYSHGAWASPYSVGEWVNAGEHVLVEGTTGATDGSCMHLERQTSGRFVDPYPLVQQIVAGGGAGAPPFPLPAGWYFGPVDGPEWSVSGFYGYREELRVWQQRMRDRGWDINPDGLYGTQTGNIAEAFQAEKGLAVDRLIGPATWAAAWTAPVT